MPAFTINKRRYELEAERIRRLAASTHPDPIRSHFTVVDGRRFPPKQLIELATGLDRADFTTHQARRVLLRLGFSASRRRLRPAEDGGAPGDPSSAPEALRPHIGHWVAVRASEVLVASESPHEIVEWLSRHRQQADSMFRVPENEGAASGWTPS